MEGFTEFVLHETLRTIKEESWVALHFDDPSISGESASEIGGGGYIRALSEWGVITNKTMWLDNTLSWDGLMKTRVTHVAGWNQEFNGRMQWVAPVSPVVRILDGGGWQLGKDTLALSFA